LAEGSAGSPALPQRLREAQNRRFATESPLPLSFERRGGWVAWAGDRRSRP